MSPDDAIGKGAGEHLPSAQGLAERWILGALLVKPRQWQEVQKSVGPADFTEANRRRLAERYWEYQRDEGEAVFNEFLASLGEEQMKVLAIELAEEAEELDDLDARLTGALEHLAELRRNRLSQETLNALLRSKDQPLTADEEIDLLRRVAQTKKIPDTRSIGPRIS